MSAGRRDRADPNPAGVHCLQRGQLVLGGRDAAEDRLRVAGERGAGVGEASPGAAIDEPYAGLAFERCQLPRRCGLRPPA